MLVSAPAGFGKTTLLSQWLAAEGQGDGRVTWLSLGPEESDLRRFLIRVVDALEGSIGTFGAEARALLQSDRAVPAESVVGSLVTDLDQLAGPTVLALDDYHVIDATEVHDAVTFLVENLPPQATLAIATRADPPLPLPRLRSRGELLELRATDLRFTADEAQMFLNEVMGLDVSPEQVDALDSRTEGWAAGLQLAALSLRGSDDPGRFVEAFTGSHRFILDYLVEEVLNNQPDDVREFLLDTSVLHELTGPLCDALTGRTDGNQTLEDLERANVFVVPLDDQRQWYRYHHLFADMLRSLAQSEPGYVNDVLRASAGQTPAGDIGSLQTLFTLVGVLYMAGGLLFGIAMFRARVLARWAAALLAVGTVATAALSVLPESFDRPFAVPTGVALIGLGISLWRTQRTSAPAAAPVAVASAVLAPAGAES